MILKTNNKMKQVYDINMINFRNIFENITKCGIKDFISKENSITIIVNEGEIGKAIGKNGGNVKNLERKFNKKIKIIEYNNNIKTFIKNLIKPIEVKKIEIEDGNVTINIPGIKEKGQIIGRDRKNIEEFKKFVSKYFEVKDIKVV